MSRKSGGKPHLPHLSQALAAPTVVPGIQPQPSNSLPQNSAPSLELSSSVEDEITSLTNGSQQPPSEVVIIRTSGKQYQSVLASAPQPSTPAPQTPVNNDGFQQQSNSGTPAESSLMPPPPNPPPLQNKVVSSNPTLNLLLSQPIVTMAQTAAARQVMQVRPSATTASTAAAAAPSSPQLPALQRLPSQRSPAQRLPVQGVPTQRLPVQGLPNQRLQTQILPSQRLPVQGLPTQRLSTQMLPSQRLPAQGVPFQRFPSGTLTTVRLPQSRMPSPIPVAPQQLQQLQQLQQPMLNAGMKRPLNFLVSSSSSAVLQPNQVGAVGNQMAFTVMPQQPMPLRGQLRPPQQLRPTPQLLPPQLTPLPSTPLPPTPLPPPPLPQPTPAMLRKSFTSSISCFNSLIRKIMHSFGDAKTPHPDSATLVEDIVQTQMRVLLEEAEQVALTRGAATVGMEDFVFLLRHDLNKLARLMRFLHFKDVKSKLASASISNKENASSSEGGGGNKDDTAAALQHSLATSIDPDAAKAETFAPISAAADAAGGQKTSSKRVRLFRDFLLAIDTPLGRYDALLSSPSSLSNPDEVTLGRHQRLYAFTERMSVRDYLYYQHCRSVSFAGVVAARFKEWLLGLPLGAAEKESASLMKSAETETEAKPKKEVGEKEEETPKENGKEEEEKPKENGEKELKEEEDEDEDEAKKAHPMHHRIKVDKYGLEVMQHLAHETVATLVELALIVKAEEDEAKRSSATAGEMGTRRSELLLSSAPEVTACFGRKSPPASAASSAPVSIAPSPLTARTSSTIAPPLWESAETRQRAVEGLAGAERRFRGTVSARLGTWTSPAAERVAGGWKQPPAIQKNPWTQTISPANIIEAMRRFEARPTVFERWTRRPKPRSARMKLLCL